ncbi:tripartite tricarboxylate transporter substrate-binding protein [Ottowia pentelensis]|uniref:tripartite tricarboxylate transporter substrate-binding protein n=1 Tax=Ottowia pentelensis TaxID=511108 RepID=UPI003627B729
MSIPFNRRLLLGLGAAALASGVFAQGASNTPVKLLVGFPPGGSIDLTARLVSEKLAAALGTTVIVENRAGAGGRLAAAVLKSAPPDGRTIMLAPSAPIVIAPYTFRKLNYDPKTDFAPVAKLVNLPLAIAVGGDSPIKTLADLTAWYKAHPRQAAFGTSAAGSQLHFLGLMYGQAIHMELTHVAYQGGAPLVTDLIGGQIPAGVDQFPLEFYKSGKIRLLATSSPERSPLLPDVPTFKEQGVNVEGQAWSAPSCQPGRPRRWCKDRRRPDRCRQSGRHQSPAGGRRHGVGGPARLRVRGRTGQGQHALAEGGRGVGFSRRLKA